MFLTIGTGLGRKGEGLAAIREETMKTTLNIWVGGVLGLCMLVLAGCCSAPKGTGASEEAVCLPDPEVQKTAPAAVNPAAAKPKDHPAH